MTDRDTFLQMARTQRVNTHDAKAYRTFLKQAALKNAHAHKLYNREMRAKQNVAQSERATQDLYIKANDKAANTIDRVSDVASMGAHRNLQAAYHKASAGDAKGAAREVLCGGLKIAASAGFSHLSGIATTKVIAGTGRIITGSRAGQAMIRVAAPLGDTGMGRGLTRTFNFLSKPIRLGPKRIVPVNAPTSGGYRPPQTLAPRTPAPTAPPKPTTEVLRRGLTEETRVATTSYTTTGRGDLRNCARGSMNALGEPMPPRVAPQGPNSVAPATRVAAPPRPPVNTGGRPPVSGGGQVAQPPRSLPPAAPKWSQPPVEPEGLLPDGHHVTTIERTLHNYVGAGTVEGQAAMQQSDMLRRLAMGGGFR